MTPNPHPASVNGDVIERAKKIISACALLGVYSHGRELGQINIENIVNSIAHLFRSEGSGDGKVREALQEIRTWFLECSQMTGRACAMEHTQREEARHIVGICDKALATPTPSPIDAAGMREADADLPTVQDVKGIIPPTPAREIDRENLQHEIKREILDAILMDVSHLTQMQKAQARQDRSVESAKRILSLIGGRHV